MEELFDEIIEEAKSTKPKPKLLVIVDADPRTNPRVAEALPKLELAGGRRVKLCRDHYCAYRRASRETRRLDRMGG